MPATEENPRLVLVVDDDPGILGAASRVLRSLPIRVKCVASGEAALDAISKEMPFLIIADYTMPGLDGLTLLEGIQARYPGVRCILHTAAKFVPPAYGRDIPVLHKPCDPEELRNLVSQVLAGS
jgi:CheY-like chemotaxis protein